MTGHDFARQRGRILKRGRGERHARRAMMHLAREAGARQVWAGGKLVGHVMPDGFTICELRRYASERAALEELANIAAFAHLQPKRIPVRAFHCAHCRGWHVSSRPARGDFA